MLSLIINDINTRSVAFTMTPLERGYFTPDKSPFLTDSIKLSFYGKIKV